MTILAGDVKLVASEVMHDVPEGGGAPTANLIVDGNSNSIFNDISELDRAGGRVSLRKTFLSVQTDTVDTYFGGNVIVADPPDDPRVAVTLFTTDAFFETRDAAAVRIESYLNSGPEWGGFLLENHISGQRVVQLGQRIGSDIPSVGQTFVIVQNEGLSTQKIQYVRTTAVSQVTRTFWDSSAGVAFDAWVVTLDISDALRYDFTGSAMTRAISRTSSGAKFRDTVVADAGTYVGAAPLAVVANLGDFTVTAETIYTQLVPSAQTETPILDVRANGLSAALVNSGGPLVQTISMGFTLTQNMHVGGPIFPGSLSIVRSGVTLIDEGGILTNAGTEVGQVDYDNGIVSLSTNVWGTGGGTHTVTFTPAAIPDLISDQRAIRVTAESRALSYVFVMDDIPLKRTTSVSYMAQGRWYVLRDNGNGVLKGTDSAYGVGTISYSTGGVSVTLGALPDVGSSIIVQSYSEVTAVRASDTTLYNDGKIYLSYNTAGNISEEAGTKTITPGAVTITWNDGAARTATDDGDGALIGDATGTVDYGKGVIKFSPNLLPAPGTVISTDLDSTVIQSATGIALASGNLGASGITPGTVAFSADMHVVYASSSPSYRLNFLSRNYTVNVFDDGAGNLKFIDPANGDLITCGTITYATGAIARTVPTLAPSDMSGPVSTYVATWLGVFVVPFQVAWAAIATAYGSRTASWPEANGNVTFDNVAPANQTINVTLDQLVARTLTVPNYTLKGVAFKIGDALYAELTDGTLLRDVSPLTGGGTPAGSVAGPVGTATVLSWPTGAPAQVTDWHGVLSPPSIGVEAPFTSFSSTFRTASSPLRPGSVSILGTMQDGTTFNVTATTEGKIEGTRVKGQVDYQFGLIELWFVDPAGDTDFNVDLTHLNIAGLSTIPADLVMLQSLRYNAVAYTYLPLDADILGIDPVRLPSDGRVPIFRPGGFAVVGHTGTISATVSNAQVVDCGRVRLSRVRVIGNDGAIINTGYDFDLELGTVTFSNVAGYSQPVTIEHRIEDMAVVSEAQISGELTFTRAVTHDYPIGSYVSSALVAGDLFARVSHKFDQATWNNVWQDTVNGSVATGTYNSVIAPIEVTNAGAVTERWALVFTGTTTFNVIGEAVGVILAGNTGVECAPINPATGSPYFSIPALGWGGGWSTGNVLRINTVGALFPVWIVRTVMQGPETVTNDSFTVLLRGDVDNPI